MPEEPLRKKQILFVDDEPLVLQGLQRMLRSLRNEWDMEFVDGGAKALEVMAQRVFDVVVTDMRMPGMNGAELLNAIVVRHPDTIRIILSGHADQDLITQCLGSAHQYLSKPCDPELLKKLINDTCRLGSGISSDRVKQVVSRIEKLPSLPVTYKKLTDALAQESSTAADLGRIISQDIGMTAKILKLVNSAFFGLRRELSNPTEAVTYLGTETIRSLVLANGIFAQADALGTHAVSLDDVWAHSLAVAQGAKAILKATGAPEREQDEAFTGGLLHDVGILILAHNFPEPYDEILRLITAEHYLMTLAEQRVLGVNHAEAGAYLIGLWGLPEVIVQCVQFHHQPSLAPGQEDRVTPLCAVHLADAFHAVVAPHPAFELSVMDEALIRQPWLKDRLESLRQTFLKSLSQF
jgi:putative nucleotidyltransferase with HDIG domain